MVAGQFAPAFPYKHQLKDLLYALDMATDSGVDLKVAQATAQLYKSAAMQLSDDDFSAVLQASRAASAAASQP